MTLDPGKEAITYVASFQPASFSSAFLSPRAEGCLAVGKGKLVEGRTLCRGNYLETSILVSRGLVWGRWPSGGSGFLLALDLFFIYAFHSVLILTKKPSPSPFFLTSHVISLQ